MSIELPNWETSLHASSLSVRLPVLRHLLEIELSSDEIDQVYTILLATIPIYSDSQSRQLASELVTKFVTVSDANLSRFANDVTTTFSNKDLAAVAVSDCLNLLETVTAVLVATKQIKTLRLPLLYCLSGLAAHSRSTNLAKSLKKVVTEHNIHDFIAKDTTCIGGQILLLDNLAKLAVEVQATVPQLYSHLQGQDIVQWFARDVILAKQVYGVPRDYLRHFVTQELFESELVPSLEKANLRQPELSFELQKQLFLGLQCNTLHGVAASKLLTQTISSFKSSKEAVRQLAEQAMITMVSQSTDLDAQTKVVEELFKNLKSNLNADYKSLVSRILAHVTPLARVVELLGPYLGKESNEQALQAMLQAYFCHFFGLDTLPDTKCVLAGVAEKKLPLRKLWLVELCHAYESSLEMSEEIKTFVLETLAHPTKAGVRATYGALRVAIKNNIDVTTSGDAWLLATLCKNDSFERQHSVQLLAETFASNPAVADSVLDALYHYAQTQGTESALESPMDIAPNRYLLPVLLSLSQSSVDKSTLCNILARFLTLTQQYKVKHDWAGIVVRAGVDPSAVIRDHFTVEVLAGPLRQASIRAIAVACFIDPQTAQRVVELVSAPYHKATKEEIEIFHGTEGEMVFNVLEKKSKYEENKNSKDYETKKWEESIRAKQTKKLTKEEQQLVNDQLAKESTIRKTVADVYASLSNRIDIISELAKESATVDNGANVWFPVAVKTLLQLVNDELVASAAIRCFLYLSNMLTDRLGVKLGCGLASLRSHNVSLPEELSEEPVVDLLSRVLFRMKFVSNKQPLDSISLIYVLPLLQKILQDGKKVAIRNANKPVSKSEFVEEDKEEELLLLALEISSAHAEEFQNPGIPRVAIIEVLLSLLALPSKAKLAKECFMALSQNISISPLPEDMDIILQGLMSPVIFVRNTILEALDQEFDLEGPAPQVFICVFDNEEMNSELATTIWQESQLQVTPDELLPFFDNTDSGLRLSVARAYAQLSNADSLQQLMNYYDETAREPEPVIDEYGLVVKSSSEQRDPWEIRSTIALAMKLMLPKEVETVVRFLIEHEALADKSGLVAQEFKEAGIEIISQELTESLIPLFDNALASKMTAQLKQNVIILYGALARHLNSEDPRLSGIVDRLVATLDTPSEDVQKAVSECLAPLVHLFRPQVGQYLEILFDKLFKGATKQARRGPAWGIAALCKGYGILALSEFDVIRTLTDAADDKKNPAKREAVAYAFECLSRSLGKFFEPYVIEILPVILKMGGDTVAEVRDATHGATKVIMGVTTSYGVSKLIPLALQNLDDIAWRSKKGSVELLGSMAYLDPTQLSASLSTIVPEIVGVLNDTHKEVRKAADDSLKRFGEVIRNPEIQQLVPTLIKAIGDPTKHTEEALDALIRTQFVHYIDGPSLALIIHVIHRGMKDRSANTKRKACKIVGNMAILVDAKDLIPYLHDLISEVEVAMVDPVPNTRATAARALGALVERLGEQQFPDLIQRLMDTLSDSTKAGDRLGAAQALSEVVSGLGIGKLDELLPEILAGVNGRHRAGFMPLMLFLPVCFGAQFAPYITQIIQPILRGLADTDEDITETALKAGRLIVKDYATKAIDLLLPELGAGMFDDNYRIRLSSVQLTGELLFQVTGISGKAELSEDQAEASSEVNRALVEVLGQERRDRILSSLFVCRSDSFGTVRQASLDIWKPLVANTPRTVKEILPTLTSIVVVHLASHSTTMRSIAAATLGDLVRRVGGNAMSQLLPTLEATLGVESDDEDSEAMVGGDSAQGVCIALRELIDSGASIVEYQDIIVRIIRRTLVSPDGIVRHLAAQAFDSFTDVVGSKYAVDEILPYLLNLLGEDNDMALNALEEIMASKSDVIFPILIPTLLEPPIDSFRANALGSLAQVAGPALYKRLSTIVDALLSTGNTDTLVKVMCSVEDDGLHALMQHVMSLLKDDSEYRDDVYKVLPAFFENTQLHYSIYTTDLVSQFVLALDTHLAADAVATLTALIKQQSKDQLETLVRPVRQSLSMLGAEPAGFAVPKGINSILPVFLHGLMYGSSEDREAAALGIADLVGKTPADQLKPYITVITGPLIRVVGERYSSDIKAAILLALNVLFAKIPQFLRPFIPQLQRTFVKSLSDANETLRSRASKALGTLIEYQPRADPLVAELVNGCRTSEPPVVACMLSALLEVVTKVGTKLQPASKQLLLSLVEDGIASAQLIGALSDILSPEEADSMLSEKVYSHDTEFAVLTLNAFLKSSPKLVLANPESCIEYLVKMANSSQPSISDNATLAIGKTMLNGVTDQRLVDVLCDNMVKPQSASLDTRRLSLVVARTVARLHYDLVQPYLNAFGPSIFLCLRDVIIPIKLAAEKAYLEVFKLVDTEDVFNEWFKTFEDGTRGVASRALGEYTKRVGQRLAKVEKERIAAGGDAEQMFSDRFEDEKEIWSVGSN